MMSEHDAAATRLLTMNGLVVRDDSNVCYHLRLKTSDEVAMLGNQNEPVDSLSLLTHGIREVPILMADRLTGANALLPQLSLGLSVERRVGSVRSQGVVSALRGLVKLGLGNGSVITVKELIEIRFDATGASDGAPRPPLSKSELGEVVFSWDGRTLGFLIGGQGYTGLVLPIATYLRHHLLTEMRSSENMPEWGSPELAADFAAGVAGIEALLGELGREPSIDLGEMPSLAA